MSVAEGEPWPKPRSRFVRVGQQILLGPSGENAAVVDWHRVEMIRKQRIIDALSVCLSEQGVQGDEVAGALPRSWKTGVGLAVSADRVDGWVRAYSGNIQHGVAYYVPSTAEHPRDQNDGHWVAGLLPDGREFGYMQVDGKEYRTVVGRTGPDTPVITPVLIRTDEAELIFPFSYDMKHSRIPEGELLAVGQLALAGLPSNPNYADAPIV